MSDILKPHISINVRSVDASVAFYQRLFGVQPVKHYRDATTVHSVLRDDQGRASTQARTGYAKFDLESPALNFVLNEVTFAEGAGALSHLGLQVAGTEDVLRLRGQAVAAGLAVRDEMQVSCCYARQDKFWVADPDGNEWEVFAVLEHLSPEALKHSDQRGTPDSAQDGCCVNAAPASCATPTACVTEKAETKVCGCS